MLKRIKCFNWLVCIVLILFSTFVNAEKKNIKSIQFFDSSINKNVEVIEDEILVKFKKDVSGELKQHDKELREKLKVGNLPSYRNENLKPSVFDRPHPTDHIYQYVEIKDKDTGELLWHSNFGAHKGEFKDLRKEYQNNHELIKILGKDKIFGNNHKDKEKESEKPSEGEKGKSGGADQGQGGNNQGGQGNQGNDKDKDNKGNQGNQGNNGNNNSNNGNNGNNGNDKGKNK